MPRTRGREVPIPRDIWKVAVLTGAASYIDAAALVSVGIAVVTYQDALSLSAGEIGVITGLLGVFFALGALAGGRLGDLFGRRRTFSVTIVAVTVGAALMMAAVAPWMLYAGVVIMAFGTGADLPVSLAMLSEEAPEGAKARLVAFSQVLWVVAGVVTVILVIAFGNLGALGGRILFGHVVLVSVLVTVFRVSMPESKEWQRARDAARTATPLPGATGDSQDPGSLKSLLKGPHLRAFAAIAVFYALVNLAANASATYTTYLYVDLAGQTTQFAGLVSFGTVGLGLVTSLWFMRVVERPSRMTYFTVGALLYVLGPLIPLVVGVDVPSLILFSLLVSVGSAFAGEPIYKVWSQELLPTLFRGSAQGASIAFARFVAAGFATVTPLLLESHPSVVFALLTVIAVVTGVMGKWWVGRMSAATAVAPHHPRADEARSAMTTA